MAVSGFGIRFKLLYFRPRQDIQEVRSCFVYPFCKARLSDKDACTRSITEGFFDEDEFAVVTLVNSEAGFM